MQSKNETGGEKGNEKSICMLAAVAYAAMALMGILADALRLFGTTMGEISTRYGTLLMPSADTFVLWKLIYLLLAIYTIYQLQIASDKRGSGFCRTTLTQKLSPLYAGSSLAAMLWMLTWHAGLILASVLPAALLLYCLIRILRMLCTQQLCLKEKICVRLPFYIYAAWALMLVIVNVAAMLISLRWSGWGISREIWTLIALSLGAAAGIGGMLLCRSISMGLVFLWAYVGILKQHTAPAGWDLQYPTAVTALLICILLFMGIIGYLLFDKRKKAVPEQ